MALLASVFVALSGLLHVYIFLMESAWWTRPKIWQRFGLASQADAETTKPLAYNQGFYNLFLAIGALLGLVLYPLQHGVDVPRRHRAHHDGAGQAEICALAGYSAADRIHPLPVRLGRCRGGRR
jgi:hypothetical protein